MIVAAILFAALWLVFFCGNVWLAAKTIESRDYDITFGAVMLLLIQLGFTALFFGI